MSGAGAWEGRGRDTNLCTLALVSLMWSMTNSRRRYKIHNLCIHNAHLSHFSVVRECRESIQNISIAYFTATCCTMHWIALQLVQLLHFFRANLHMFARQQLSSPSLHNLGWGPHPLLCLMIIVWWREDVVITGFTLGVTANLLILLIFKYEFQICHHHFTV